MAEQEVVSFIDLPWEHVICRHVFPLLPIHEIFQLRVLSKQYKQLVETYFKKTFTIDLSKVSSRVTMDAFILMTHDNLCLKSLVLSNAKDWLTDKVLKPVLFNNQQLQKIDLTNCSNITDVCISTIAISCPDLHTLILKDCHWLSVAAIRGLLVNCLNLEHVDLTGCWNMDDEIIGQLLVYCKKMRNLSISKIYGLTDHAISLIAHNSPNLEILNMHGCWRITNESVRLLGEFCPSLQVLYVKDCRSVNEISLASLRARGIKMDVPAPVGADNLSRLQQNLHRLHLQI